MLARADAWSGLVLALVGLGLFWLSQDIRITEVGLVGPRFVPQVVSILLVASGVALAMNAQQNTTETTGQSPWRAAGLVLIGLAYVFLTPRIGYLATSALVAAATLTLFGVRDWRVLLAGTLALPTIMHLVFIELMGVFMPRGRWLDLLAFLP